MKKHLPLLIAFLLGALLFFGLARLAVSQSHEKEFHEHADFAVFIDGVPFDFTRDKYMSIEPCKISSLPLPFVQSAYAHGGEEGPEGHDLRDWVHLHNGIGSVIHVHKEGITYDQFFESLGMDFHDTYFEDDEWNRYEENGEKEFVILLNGERVEEIAESQIRNLDRVLISYGDRGRSESEVWAEYGQITNLACIASEVCLHREPLAEEACGVQSTGFLQSLLGL